MRVKAFFCVWEEEGRGIMGKERRRVSKPGRTRGRAKQASSGVEHEMRVAWIAA